MLRVVTQAALGLKGEWFMPAIATLQQSRWMMDGDLINDGQC